MVDLSRNKFEYLEMSLIGAALVPPDWGAGKSNKEINILLAETGMLRVKTVSILNFSSAAASYTGPCFFVFLIL